MPEEEKYSFKDRAIERERKRASASERKIDHETGKEGEELHANVMGVSYGSDIGKFLQFGQ